MNLTQFILVLAVFIPTIVYSRRLSYDELESALEEFYPQSRTINQLNSDCNWITYDLDATVAGYTDSLSYSCPKVTLAAPFCVLTWSDAVALCNSDSECGGLSLTLNHYWHDMNDRKGETTVYLYSTTSEVLTDNKHGKWYTFPKKCWKYDS
ncbi:unnamed protein product [Adineta steineri]|uniref:Uncharacterized protein n=1 Tax=Adineta steineri TaxID=433720 RepID=A0A819DNQ6_9BILA|nr:unnamed protein product [Adineta steineri]CAF0759724.1 unnamed protein product [Adineta steineri]CAF3838621.1 unnamed protein product [Adineta steineri]CAF4063377.1 unnamed protein product [Adineta steineri]